MSFAQIEQELTTLAPEALEHLRAVIDAEMARKTGAAPVSMAQYLGCTRGMMTFRPWK